MKWVLLAAAIVLEVFATTALKLSDGFTKLWWGAAMAVAYLLCFGCLTLAIKKLDVGTAYAIWAGVGTSLIAVVGLVLFDERFSWIKVAGIVMVIAGVVAINLGGESAAH